MPDAPDILARLALLSAPLIVALMASLSLAAGAAAQDALALDEGPWHLWPDREAAWKDDPLYLPDEVRLAELPARPPTGGWTVLDDGRGISVTLPATVEQHFWGAFGRRRYQDEYYLETLDDQVQNGGYRGVSWWWRDLEIPASWQGKQLLLHVRGARLRAEVFMNEELVGYHLIGETPFTCDITGAARPGGSNRLALRITNPGGRLDWVDTKLWHWGDHAFFAGHGFGGLDAGIRITAHDPVRIDDLWVLNDPDPHTVHAHARMVNTSRYPCDVCLEWRLRDERDASIDGPAASIHARLAPGESRVVEHPIRWPQAELWDLAAPRLYTMAAALQAQPAIAAPAGWRDRARVLIGFRWFEAEGVGRRAVLRLNGRRIRLISAISWGYWGLNGLFPTADLARREVEAARRLGLNCLQFHRNIGKTEVLDAGDRLGLLRYMEPGGGQTALGESYSLYADSPSGALDTSGDGGTARTFAERYMEEKIIRMVRAHRSHPSLLIWCLQNEINPDLRNPRIHHLLRRIHEEDPSRIVLLDSGIPPTNQAWMQPWSDEIRCDRGDGWSGWRDEHTVGGPGVWRDALYEGPRAFTHRSTVADEIVVWGEMLGAAVPDDHPALLAYVDAHGGKSYDRLDHEEQLAATEAFLDRWGFRASFPDVSDLLRRIGDKCYDFWGRVIRTARIAEANDYLVISGWESTAIENHSGLVDSVRGFKGRPELLARGLAPLTLAIQPRSLVWAKGARAVADIFLLNETGKPAGTLIDLGLESGGKAVPLGRLAVASHEADRFVYPAGEGIETPPLEEEGRVALVARLAGPTPVTAREELLIVDPAPPIGRATRVAVLAEEAGLTEALAAIPGVTAERWTDGLSADVIVAGCVARTGQFARVEPEREISGTDEDELYRTIEYGEAGDFDYRFEVPPGRARVTFKFAEMFADKPAERVFDVAINGAVVLPEFDVLSAAGGKNVAIDKTLEVAAPEGIIAISVPRVVRGSARFCAIKVEAAGQIQAINCGGAPYTDAGGLTWGRQPLAVPLTEPVLEAVRDGTPLLVWSEGARAAIGYAEQLGAASPSETSGGFRCLGDVGTSRASWMGAWFFTRPHPLLDGLPAGDVMRSFFQAPVTDANGVLVDGDETEIVIAYGRDHDRRLGAAAFTGRLGRGRFLAINLPGLLTGLTGTSRGLHPIIARRLLANAVAFLADGR